MRKKRSLVRSLLASGCGTVEGLVFAPMVPPHLILPVSIIWYLGLGILLWSAYRVLSFYLGRAGAIGLLALGTASPILLTSIDAPPALAMRLPCPRNWSSLTTWQLRASPLESLRFTVGSAQVKLCYGSPAARGRARLGGSEVPYGKLWRTGANEPTLLITTAPLEVAGVLLPAGRAALYSVPGPESWELILTAATSQWGIESEYTPEVRARELGRAILPSGRGEPVERLRFAVEPGVQGAHELVLAWETARLRVPLRQP